MSVKKVVQYVSAVCVMVATTLCWWDEFLFVILMVLAGWLLLPMVVVVVVSWFMNLKLRKALFVLDSVALVFLIAYLTIGNAQQRYDADIMERHLAKKQDAMLAAIDYTHQVLAKDSRVTIEFSHGRLERFYINNGTYSAIDEADLQQKMRFVGLTKEEMRNIRRMLRQADCIGITTHADYTELRYRRVGFGLYQKQNDPEGMRFCRDKALQIPELLTALENFADTVKNRDATLYLIPSTKDAAAFLSSYRERLETRFVIAQTDSIRAMMEIPPLQ